MQYMIRDVERLHGVRAPTLGGVVENIAHDAQHMAPAFLGRQIAFYAVRSDAVHDSRRRAPSRCPCPDPRGCGREYRARRAAHGAGLSWAADSVLRGPI